MASMNQISINFTATKQRASELEDIADRLEKLGRRDAQDILSGLAGNWKGDNSTLYLQKGNELREDIGKTAASIRKLATTIRQIGQNIYDAEMEALRIAEERKAQAEAKARAEAEAKAQAEAEAKRQVEAINQAALAAIKGALSRNNK